MQNLPPDPHAASGAPEPADAPVLKRWDGDICRLTLNRPEQANVLSPAMVDGLDTALDDCAARGASVLVIEGAGKHFCTGFDLSSMAAETDDSLLARFVRIELLLQRLARAPCITVAVARGRSVGAGADLFAACNHRLIDRDASFAFPGARGFGLVLGSRRLASRVGPQRAFEWVSTGRAITRDEALVAGLASARFDDPAEIATKIAAIDQAIPPGGAGPLLRALEGSAADDDARDLAALVRSAARAGVQGRIADYLSAQARPVAR